MAVATNAYESKYTGQQIETVLDYFHRSDVKTALDQVPALVNNVDRLKTDTQQLDNKISSEVINRFASYLPLAGGGMTNAASIRSSKSGQSYANAHSAAFIQLNAVEGTYRPVFSLASKKNSSDTVIESFSCGVTTDETLSFRFLQNSTSKEIFHATKEGTLIGADWNDYAEFRQSNEHEAGRVVYECGDGTLKRATERLQSGAEIVSDTFGFAIGKTNICNTPIAISGRVLAYPNENIDTYAAGDAVCSGPNGTVSKMTREEIMTYPERIIGIVSEIPTYDTWGEHNIKVNQRIWIRIK